jgi:hypothetical protein
MFNNLMFKNICKQTVYIYQKYKKDCLSTKTVAYLYDNQLYKYGEQSDTKIQNYFELPCNKTVQNKRLYTDSNTVMLIIRILNLQINRANC